MKIIEGDEDQLNICLNSDDTISLSTCSPFGHIPKFMIDLDPIAAHELGTLLIKLANETDYFKGLKKDE